MAGQIKRSSTISRKRSAPDDSDAVTGGTPGAEGTTDEATHSDTGNGFMPDHITALVKPLRNLIAQLRLPPGVTRLLVAAVGLSAPIMAAAPFVMPSKPAIAAFSFPWSSWHGNEFRVVAKEVDPAKLGVPAGCKTPVDVDLSQQSIYGLEMMTIRIGKVTDSTHAAAEITSEQVPGTTQVNLSVSNGVLRIDFGGDSFMFLNMQDDHGIVTGWMTYHDCAIGKAHLMTPVAAAPPDGVKLLNERQPLAGKTASALEPTFTVH